MKACPLCKTSVIHYRGHGDHVITCAQCSITFCYLCLFVFRKRSLSSISCSRSESCSSFESSSSNASSSSYSAISSYNTTSTMITSQVKHYKYSNCNENCDEVCCCNSCPICLILYKDHCGKCNPIYCERYNHSLNCIKIRYELKEENPSGITNSIVPK